jgi:iron complex transport system ATP-binding protein
VIKCKNLSFGYTDSLVLDDISLEIKKGDLMTIIGVNGSGKSTLLKTMSRILKPFKGTVYLDGKSIFTLDTRTIARKLAMLPQSPKIPDDFTVYNLVSFGRHPYLGWNGRMGIEDIKVIDWAIKATHIESLQHRLVSTLSGGERQRAWLAFALAQNPKVLLLDEPTTFLDIGCQMEILELVKSLNNDMGITIIMVLHDLNMVARYSNTLAVLKDGKIFKIGTPNEIITEEVLEEVFDVKAKIFTESSNNCPYFIPFPNYH